MKTAYQRMMDDINAALENLRIFREKIQISWDLRDKFQLGQVVAFNDQDGVRRTGIIMTIHPDSPECQLDYSTEGNNETWQTWQFFADLKILNR